MGQNQSIFTQIEIAAPPETVRSVVCRYLAQSIYKTNKWEFLDFNRYPEWHRAWSFSTGDLGKEATDLQPGDRFKMNRKGTFPPDVETILIVRVLRLFFSSIRIRVLTSARKTPQPSFNGVQAFPCSMEHIKSTSPPAIRLRAAQHWSILKSSGGYSPFYSDQAGAWRGKLRRILKCLAEI
jgi:hypothetical protein